MVQGHHLDEPSAGRHYADLDQSQEVAVAAAGAGAAAGAAQTAMRQADGLAAAAAAGSAQILPCQNYPVLLVAASDELDLTRPGHLELLAAAAA